jgi:hypothetical protein
MGLEDCAGGGLRCSRYLGLFDCAVVRFWFHEYELIVDFVVDEHGRLASVVIEGPVFVGPVLFRLGLIVTLGILHCIEISVVAIIVWFLMLHAIVFVRWLLLGMVVTILL